MSVKKNYEFVEEKRECEACYNDTFEEMFEGLDGYACTKCGTIAKTPVVENLVAVENHRVALKARSKFFEKIGTLYGKEKVLMVQKMFNDVESSALDVDNSTLLKCIEYIVARKSQKNTSLLNFVGDESLGMLCKVTAKLMLICDVSLPGLDVSSTDPRLMVNPQVNLTKGDTVTATKEKLVAEFKSRTDQVEARAFVMASVMHERL